ncbi:hypothetical protein Tco_1581892 [Tanacetum coccineum]
MGSGYECYVNRELISVIESLQTQTKEMEENTVSKEEMLKTNEKTKKGEYAEDDNSNDKSFSYSSSSDEQKEEDDIEGTTSHL